MTLNRLARLIAVVGGLTAIIVFLHWAGRFDLTGPTRWNVDELRAWIGDPILVVATIARWLALVLAYYLLAVILLLAASRRSERFARLVPRRWLAPLAAVLGVTAAVGPLTLANPGVDSGTSHPLRLEPTSPALVLNATIEQLPDPDPAAVAAPAVRPEEARPDGGATPSVPAPGSMLSEWLVVPGESMWSIACDSLVEAWGRPVSDAEIVPYWQGLIDVNRERLVEPGNPDLILPGQQFLIPDVPPDPGGR